LTLDIVSETDIIPDFELPQGLRANVVGVQQVKQVTLRNEAIPPETTFQQHVQNVFTFLKEAASLKQLFGPSQANCVLRGYVIRSDNARPNANNRRYRQDRSAVVARNPFLECSGVELVRQSDSASEV
jgi:hypothetical protein